MRKENAVVVKNNKVILNLIQDLQRLPLQLVNNLRGRSRIKYGMTSLYNNGGFTLIELLVVVLIIGILAAVAVPQYKKAVEKSRLSVYMPVVKALAQAEEAYYLANGDYTYEFDKLDIDLPIAGCTHITNDQYGQYYHCPERQHSLGVWNGPTNAQFHTANIAYLQFFEDFTGNDGTEYKKGDIWCFSKNDISRAVCKSLGAGTEYEFSSGWKWRYVLRK